jgi:hypothetical protein
MSTPRVGWIICILVLTDCLAVKPQAAGFPQASGAGAAEPAAEKSTQTDSPTRTKLNLHPEQPEPVDDGEITASVALGVAFLLRDPNADGSWGSPQKTKELNIMAGVGSHHAFRTAVTALCVSALIEVAGPRNKLLDPTAVRLPIQRGEDFLFRELPRVRRDQPMLI